MRREPKSATLTAADEGYTEAGDAARRQSGAQNERGALA